MAEPEVKQRLAAILAADVAGYSRLMSNDEPATIATLREHRDVFRDHIEANDGRVVDMAGDSVLAVLPSATGAVTAAVDAQRALAERNDALEEHRRMRFRVGVNLGDIREAEDGTVYGDGVNVAARLEGLAEPGGVMISEDAYRQVRRDPHLRFTDAGAYDVKNIAEPVRAYRLVTGGSRAAPRSASRRKRLTGIAAGMAALVSAVAAVAWWQMRAPEPPAMLTAEGEPTDDPILAMPTGPSIAVLPFADLTGAAEPDYFAEGLTEEIITELSRFRDLFVIARNSTAQ